MGGFFGVASKSSCVNDLFFGVDYHSHLGTRRGGMAVYSEEGFTRAIHNIENSPFRTKFDHDLDDLKGNYGIGCISDYEPQPLLIQSHLGSFAIATVGKILNEKTLIRDCYEKEHIHFQEMSHGRINATELVAAIINEADSLSEGLLRAQEKILGSMTILLLTPEGIYVSRDRLGRTPAFVGKKEGAYCVSFENFAYFNLGYEDHYELGPGEIVRVNTKGVDILSPARQEMRICSFLWVYYGYPTATYENVNVEEMRYRSGEMLAKRDIVEADSVAGIPDSGIAHAVGYSNKSGIPYTRPFIKYTPTWPRSFMPTRQDQRDLIAHMKLIPVKELIRNKKLLIIDDSIVRGTQLGQTTEFLYQSGAKEVHIRPACPPLLFGCKYINFSRSKDDYDMITRRVIRDREGENVPPEVLADYADPDSRNYKEMLEEIRKILNFTTLRYQRLDDLIEAIGLPECKVCTYCWSGRE